MNFKAHIRVVYGEQHSIVVTVLRTFHHKRCSDETILLLRKP